MERRDRLLSTVGEVVQRIGETGDPSPAWSPGVLAMADDLARCHGEAASMDIETSHLLGWLRWYQAASAPEERRHALVEDAFRLLAEASIAIGWVEFPEPLLPALVDEAAARLAPMLMEATTRPDTDELADLVGQWIHVVNATPDDHLERARRLSLACAGLVSLVQRTNTASDLDQALAAGRRAVELAGDDRDLGMYLSNLGTALKIRYERTREPADLDEAITVARRAVSAAAGHEGLASAASNLSGVLALRASREGRADDAAEAVRAARQAVAAASPYEPSRAAMLNNLAQALHKGFMLIGSAADLDDALDAARQAVPAGEGTPYAAMCLSTLVDVLQSRFNSTQSDADLDEAIEVARRLAAITPLELRPRAHDLMVLASLLSTRASRNDDAADLDELIKVGRQAADADPESVPVLVGLSTSLLIRAEMMDMVADLDEATELARSAVVHAGSGNDEETLLALRQLDHVLWACFKRSRAPADLDELIVTRRSMTGATPAGASERAEHLGLLGQALYLRFRDHGMQADLDDGVAAFRAALDAATICAEPMVYRSDLACALLARFEHVGARADLDEAADLARIVAAIRPPEPPPEVLVSMAIVLDTRARSTGHLDDLDAAIGLVRRAATATAADRPHEDPAPGHIQLRVEGVWADPGSDEAPGQNEVLRLLGVYLSRRFKWTAVQADADALVQLRREIVAGTATDRTQRARDLAALGYTLKLRYLHSSIRADLDEAGKTLRQALALEPGNAAYLASLSDAMRLRFLADQDDADLAEAVELGRRAAKVGAQDTGRRADAYENLAQLLKTRFELYSTDADETLDAAQGPLSADDDRCIEADPYFVDIDEAVDAARQALAADDDNFARPERLLVLGDVLRTRITHGRIRSDWEDDASREEDRAEALSALCELVYSPTAAPRHRIYAARLGGWLAAVDPTTPTANDTLASDLLETAVRLLPEVAPRRMRRSEQQDAIGSAAGLADDAAAFALSEPTRPSAERAQRAISLLEAGRSVLLGRILDTRGDLSGLRMAHPELATRFATLRDFLDRESDPALPGGDDRVGAATELAATLEEIRSLDGFGTFALPPTAEELLAAADQGPVVSFNVAYRSDALILSPGGIRALHLPGVTAATVIDQVNAFHVALREAHDPAADRVAAQHTLAGVLGWLWDAVTGPVLKALGYNAPPADGVPAPRVWWAPGGFLGLLPLHAAGHHDDAIAGHTVMDRVVSSYTPTIRALHHARRRATDHTSVDRSLIVAMPTTPGLPDLLDVSDEAAALTELLPDPLLLTGPDRDRVLAELRGRAVAHFACHGGYDADDPAASRLLLRDHEHNPLTVADLGGIDLDDAQLAYLSACHTALNPAERLLGEGMHLAGALQAAGFPQVVATLWELDDEIAREITDDFYLGLRDAQTGRLNLGQAAYSLHQAVLKQRDRYPGTPSLWAAHLHFGA